MAHSPRALAQAQDVARKIEAMAAEPVDDMVQKMRLMGFGPQHQRIVLNVMLRKVAAALAAVDSTARGDVVASGGRDGT